MRFMAFVSVLLCTAVFAADSLVEKWQKRIDSADAAYSAAVKKADDTRFYAVQKANGERLTVLKKALADATKAGDFDAATTLKGLVAAAEKDGISRPKPKNTVKFGGHEYALIEEKVTWHIAKRICEEMGGHLVTFETSNEQQFCLDACRRARAGVWIGVSNEVNVNQFVWVTGAPANVDATWQFDNGNANEFSVAIAYWPPSGSFNDHNFGAHEFFICEWDK